jgi:hypothetical protein
MLTPTSGPAEDEPSLDRSMLVLQVAIALVAAAAAGLLSIVS